MDSSTSIETRRLEIRLVKLEDETLYNNGRIQTIDDGQSHDQMSSAIEIIVKEEDRSDESTASTDHQNNRSSPDLSINVDSNESEIRTNSRSSSPTLQDSMAVSEENKRNLKLIGDEEMGVIDESNSSLEKRPEERTDEDLNGNEMTNISRPSWTGVTFSPEEIELYRKPFHFGWKREFIFRKVIKKGYRPGDVYYVAPSGARLRSLPQVEEYLREASDKVTKANFLFRRIILGFIDDIPGAQIIKGSPAPELTNPNQNTSGVISTNSGDSLEDKASERSNSTMGRSKRSRPKPKKKLIPVPALSSSSGGSSSLMQKLRKEAITETKRKRSAIMKGDVISDIQKIQTSPREERTPTPQLIRNKARKSVPIGQSLIADGNELSMIKEEPIQDGQCDLNIVDVVIRNDKPCRTYFRSAPRDAFQEKDRKSLNQQCNECQLNSNEQRNEENSIMHGEIEEILGPARKRPCSHTRPKTSVVYQRESSSSISSAASAVTNVYSNSGSIAVLPATSAATASPAPAVIGKLCNSKGRAMPARTERSRGSFDYEFCYSPPLDMATELDNVDMGNVKIIINGTNHFEPISFNQPSPFAFPFTFCNGYIQALVSIFQFLPVRDLLRVRLVCKAWNSIVHAPEIWKRSHMKGCLIRNEESWKSAINFIRRRGVDELDLTGCGHGSASMRQFIESALPSLGRFIEGLHFGQVLPKVLDATAKTCGHNLRRLTMTLAKDPYSSSEWISSASLTSLIQCRELTELRLAAAGSTGKKQRVCINGEGLPYLASLTNLRVLVLFDVRALNEKIFEFLGRLIHLRVLEIGDCQCWTKETYNKLRNLCQLRRLRLEYFEPGQAGDVLAEVLSSLHNLREIDFIKYSFDYSFASSLTTTQPLTALSSLPNLHTLRLYPDLRGKWPAATWRRTVDAIPHFSRLKRLEFGITLDDDAALMATLSSEVDILASSKPPFICNRPRQPQRIAYLNKEALKEWIVVKVPNTVVNVVDGVSGSDLAATRESKWW